MHFNNKFAAYRGTDPSAETGTKGRRLILFLKS